MLPLNISSHYFDITFLMEEMLKYVLQKVS